MKKALIQGTRICEIKDVGEDFPVHKDLKWVDVADDTTDKDTYENGVVVHPVQPTALEIWEKQMELSDGTIPRWAEDIYDALSATSKGNVNSVTADKIAAKKALRGQKP